MCVFMHVIIFIAGMSWVYFLSLCASQRRAYIKARAWGPCPVAPVCGQMHACMNLFICISIYIYLSVCMSVRESVDLYELAATKLIQTNIWRRHYSYAILRHSPWFRQPCTNAFLRSTCIQHGDDGAWTFVHITPLSLTRRFCMQMQCSIHINIYKHLTSHTLM